MERIIDLLRLMKQNDSMDIIHFERIIEKETSKPYEILIENGQIKLFYKVTGRYKGIYSPTDNFVKLANAFIEYNRPTLRLHEVEHIRNIFLEFNIKHKLI